MNRELPTLSVRVRTLRHIYACLSPVIVLVMLSFVNLQCSKSDSSSTIKIGVLLPLSGDAAVWGKGQKDGYELALAQINGGGGVRGKKLSLIYGDDQGLPAPGVSQFRKFLDVDGIRILTGVANSSVALAIMPIVNDKKVLFISSGASSPKLTGSSKYFFRTWPSDNAEAIAMAKYARQQLGLKRICVLYMNNDYGVGLYVPFDSTFRSLGGSVVGSEVFLQGCTDFRTQLTKLQSFSPDAIYLAGNPREMGRAIRQARELGIQTGFLSISTLNDQEVLSITGPEAIEGTIITDASFDPTSSQPSAKKFMSDFRVMFGHQPGILANTSYDALMVLSNAIQHVGEGPDSLQAYIHGVKLDNGVSGPIEFTVGGDIARPVRIAVAKEGKFVTLINDFRWVE